MSNQTARIMGRIARHRIVRPSSACISPAQISRFEGVRATIAVDNIPCSLDVRAAKSRNFKAFGAHLQAFLRFG
jgi:hypothetical protein